MPASIESDDSSVPYEKEVAAWQDDVAPSNNVVSPATTAAAWSGNRSDVSAMSPARIERQFTQQSQRFNSIDEEQESGGSRYNGYGSASSSSNPRVQSGASDTGPIPVIVEPGGSVSSKASAKTKSSMKPVKKSSTKSSEQPSAYDLANRLRLRQSAMAPQAAITASAMAPEAGFTPSAMAPEAHEVDPVPRPTQPPPTRPEPIAEPVLEQPVPLRDLRDTSQLVKCPRCSFFMGTHVEEESLGGRGICSWLSCGSDETKDVVHYCGKCKTRLVTVFASGETRVELTETPMKREFHSRQPDMEYPARTQALPAPQRAEHIEKEVDVRHEMGTASATFETPTPVAEMPASPMVHEMEGDEGKVELPSTRD